MASYGKGTQENMRAYGLVIAHAGRARLSVVEALSVMFPYLKHQDEYGCEVMSMSQEQIADKAFNGNKTQAKRAIDAALATGYLVRLKDGVKGSAAVYAFVHTSANNPETEISTQLEQIGTQLEKNRDTVGGSSVHTPTNKSEPTHSSPSSSKPYQDAEGSRFPSRDEVYQYMRRIDAYLDADYIYDTFDDRGWLDKDGHPIRDWKKFIRAYDKTARKRSGDGEQEPEQKGPPERITVDCEGCGRKATAFLQDDGSYKAKCYLCGHNTTIRR